MSVLPITVPPKKLSQSILSTDSSFVISNILSWDGVNNLTAADLGTVAYAIFTNDTRTQLEIMQIDPATIASASITISARGLSYSGASTSAAARKFAWTANETTIQLGTDFPQLFQYYKDYIDAIAIAGAPNATTALQGLVELGTQAEIDAGTATGGTGASLVATPATTRAKKYNDYAADSVGTDAYAITVTPAITAYAAGQEFTFKAGTANTGACTLNVSTLGAITIKKNYNEDLLTGDIVANQIVKVVYDASGNFQVVSKLSGGAPVVRTYTTASSKIGGSTTQFDITNPAGTTFRYTFDSTGTDPSLSLANNPIGSLIQFKAQNFTAANNGFFVITGAGSNYVEVTNASGVAENDKTIGTGYVVKSGTGTWTKPSGLRYITVELVAAGGGSATASSTSSNDSATAGAGAGAYSRKTIATASLGATEYYLVGTPGEGAGVPGGSASTFGVHLTAYGGEQGGSDTGGIGGIATSGDVNIKGGDGKNTYSGSTSSAKTEESAGAGGSSYFGGSGNSASTGAYGTGADGVYANGNPATTNGFAGQQGIIILTEYYS